MLRAGIVTASNAYPLTGAPFQLIVTFVPGLGMDQQIIPLAAQLEVVSGHARVITPGTVANIEPPGVQRTTHYTSFQMPYRQTGAHVRARVVDRKELAVNVKDRNHTVCDFE